MTTSVLDTVLRRLDSVGRDLWSAEASNDDLDKALEKITSLKVQVAVQMPLRDTMNSLRQYLDANALPKQQATKVKHFIRFVFRRGRGQEYRPMQLRALDCDVLKFYGLSFTPDEIIKMEDAEFQVLLDRGVEFFKSCDARYLLYRPDVDKAVDAKFDEADDDGSYDTFMRNHAILRLQMRKRKYQQFEEDKIPTILPSSIAEDSAGVENNALEGDVFLVDIGNLRQMLSSTDEIGEIWLTNLKRKYNSDVNKRSFLTLWVSEAMGQDLGSRSTSM